MVEDSGGGTVLPEHAAATLEAANGARQDCRRDRCEEFLKADLPPLARRVADAFVASAETPADRYLTDAALAGHLADKGGYDDRVFLIAKGYVRLNSPEALSRTPGIPSRTDDMGMHIPTA